jgi:hypothetical protein
LKTPPSGGVFVVFRQEALGVLGGEFEDFVLVESADPAGDDRAAACVRHRGELR